MDLALADVPEGMSLQIIHLHPDNSSRKQREGSRYRTIARLWDRDTEELVAEASAKCNKLDAPCRKQGYHIARGRVLAKVLR